MIRKRSISFDDDLHPQMKTHVGEKEVNLGVKKEANMKAVYAKTLDMLFKGSSLRTPKESSNPERQDVKMALPHYKQMFLNSKCQLQTWGNFKDINKYSCAVSFCQSFDCNALKCNFCEKHLRESCVMACRKCELYYCSSCMFPVYEGDDEFTVCRSCY